MKSINIYIYTCILIHYFQFQTVDMSLSSLSKILFGTLISTRDFLSISRLLYKII